MSTSSSQKLRRAQRARAFLDELVKRYPNGFSRDPKAIKPLAIGTLEAITEDLKKDPEWSDTPKWLIRQSLAVYTRTPSYLRALAGGEHRHNLDGSVAEAVSETARSHAQAQLDARKPAKKPAPPKGRRGRPGGRKRAPAGNTGSASESKLQALQRKFNDSPSG